ncbi:MAG: hypothetical protein MZV70_39135 [Desulfobacterales bacterium]|nr:hypothetical protein [Desulfobacterales bacterium]
MAPRLPCVLAELDLADIVLIDVQEGMSKGKALDMAEASPLMDITAGSRIYE